MERQQASAEIDHLNSRIRAQAGEITSLRKSIQQLEDVLNLQYKFSTTSANIKYADTTSATSTPDTTGSKVNYQQLGDKMMRHILGDDVMDL